MQPMGLRLPGCGRGFPTSRSQMLCRMLAHWKYFGDLLWHPLLYFPVRSSATSSVRLKRRALEVQLSLHLLSASVATDGRCRDCVHGGWFVSLTLLGRSSAGRGREGNLGHLQSECRVVFTNGGDVFSTPTFCQNGRNTSAVSAAQNVLFHLARGAFTRSWSSQ